MANYSHFIPFSIPFVVAGIYILAQYVTSVRRERLNAREANFPTDEAADPNHVRDADDAAARPLGRLPYAYLSSAPSGLCPPSE